MIARLNSTGEKLKTSQSYRTLDHLAGPRANAFMGRITADFDRGVLTLRGTVDRFTERQFAEDAYTALSSRQTVLNLITVRQS